MNGVEKTAAELIVERMDGYTQEQHQAGIAAARDRAHARSEQRRALASRMTCPVCRWPVDNPAHELGCKA